MGERLKRSGVPVLDLERRSPADQNAELTLTAQPVRRTLALGLGCLHVVSQEVVVIDQLRVFMQPVLV